MDAMQESMQDFEQGIFMDKEVKVWSWLPLYAVLSSDLVLAFVIGLLKHTSNEFEVILA